MILSARPDQDASHASVRYDAGFDIALIRLHPAASCARTDLRDGRYLLGYAADDALVCVGIADPGRSGIDMSALPGDARVRGAALALARDHGFAITR